MNEAPDRVWIDHNNPDNQYDCDEVHITPNMVEYIRKDAACVEVREGYHLAAFKHIHEPRPLREALTIRTVEDVRREALMGAYSAIGALPNAGDSGVDHGMEIAARAVAKLINTRAPSREKNDWSDESLASIDRAKRVVSEYQTALEKAQPTPASHAEELRKAKEDAWDEGYQWAYDGMSQRNPYRRSTDEGGGK